MSVSHTHKFPFETNEHSVPEDVMEMREEDRERGQGESESPSVDNTHV